MICGYGEVGVGEPRSSPPPRRSRAAARATSPTRSKTALLGGDAERPCFDLNPSRCRGHHRGGGAVVMYGDGASRARRDRRADPRAIISRPQAALPVGDAAPRFPDAPIYARANGRAEREALVGCGASATILESEELAAARRVPLSR